MTYIVLKASMFEKCLQDTLNHKDKINNDILICNTAIFSILFSTHRISVELFQKLRYHC